MLSTALTVVGDVAAVMAAVFAFLSLRLARNALGEAQETTRLAIESREDAEAARREAAVDRREAERDRQRRRLERVGEVVEDVFWIATTDCNYNPPTKRFNEPRNRLRHALVGLQAALPECVKLLSAAGAEQARGAASTARIEVETALAKLDTE